MRLFKYLGKHKGAVALVFVLLFGQAFCDLMLPNYTSKIVDVGIQQSGIERVAPRELSADTYDAVFSLMSPENRELLAQAYEPEEDLDGGRAPAQGDSQVEAPAENPLGAKRYTFVAQGDADKFIDQALALPLAQVHGLASEDVSEDLQQQVGIAAARAEYEALGYDMGAMQMEYLLITGLKMMGFVALGALISVLVGLVASRTGAKIGRELRSRLFTKVMAFSDAEVQKFSAASLITRATNDVQQIQMMSILLMRMVLFAPILGIGGIIMVARTNSSMGWIVGVAILAVIVVVAILMMLAMPKFKIMQKLVDRVNLVSRERLTGVQVVRAFGRQDTELERFDVASTDLMRTQLFTNRVMTFMMPTIFLIMNVVSIAIVWVGAGQVDIGAIQTGDLIAFITYSMMIMFGFVMLSMLAIIAPRADVSAGRIDEVLEAEVSISDSARQSAICNAPATEEGASEPEGSSASGRPIGATIAFDHVSFSYGDDSECVLSDVTFMAEAGKTCAIIGPTGSGKSTILKLIERFYDVDEGSVTVDGVDVRAWQLHDLRAQLGYVPQRAFLFTGTIASNVGFSADDMDEARILEAVDIAQASELVQAKEDGLDAEITQGGTNVSGGQRQRLAIARALASDARALLFDDSFSALDYKTDAALRRALAERLPGKTQIIVAQRIATVMQADRIVVLDEGRVVGQGTHAELLRGCEQYREIAYSQLSPEELDADSGRALPVSGGGERS
ncbi:MAG: ABC transporter ATP-binding protein [Eggerthellaceae bacterium]|nr:ABC transporter ATP-binding protein [Eggerthellaceae bacterium]